jgi:hypothetical protein
MEEGARKEMTYHASGRPSLRRQLDWADRRTEASKHQKTCTRIRLSGRGERQ